MQLRLDRSIYDHSYLIDIDRQNAMSLRDACELPCRLHATNVQNSDMSCSLITGPGSLADRFDRPDASFSNHCASRITNL